jgi:glycosyl transferase family 25
MKIFVLHYSKLVDRKKLILEQFENHNITDYEFIDKYDKDEITDEESNIFDANYKKSLMSLFLKHIYVYKLIADKYESALIFEDDVILCNDFTDKLNNYINQLPEHYDMLFIGDGCNLHIANENLIANKNIYEKCLYPTSWGGDGATRCTDSIVISKKCAKKIGEYINNLKCKINLPIDWFLNVSARDNNFIIYWAEPTIVSQGSQSGFYQSTLN